MMYTLKKIFRRIRWNREKIRAVITAAGSDKRRYPAKAAVLKAKMDKFSCVTLYDLENKVLRPMRTTKQDDFVDDLEQEEQQNPEQHMDSDVDQEPSLAREKNPKRVAASRLGQYIWARLLYECELFDIGKVVSLRGRHSHRRSHFHPRHGGLRDGRGRPQTAMSVRSDWWRIVI